MTRIAVIGASGFVGSAVVHAFREAGHEVLAVRAPRILADPSTHGTAVELLSAQLAGCDVVVNCAGNPDASAAREGDLRAANAVLPGVIGQAAQQAAVARYVHVSSAVVQGRLPVLDSSTHTDAFSPYARSKADGEIAARTNGPPHTTVYRPPSVHGPTRRVTRQLTFIARSPLSTVAFPGDRPTPQTHIVDVADAILTLATSTTPPPAVVHHPWQGQTTSGLLRLLGHGRSPRNLPLGFAELALAAGDRVSRLVPRLGPYLRRVEMIWFGQRQASSWLSQTGWRPITTDNDWILLADQSRQPAPYTPTKDTQ